MLEKNKYSTIYMDFRQYELLYYQNEIHVDLDAMKTNQIQIAQTQNK